MRALMFVLLVMPLGLFAQEQIESIQPSAPAKPAVNMEPPASIAPVIPIAPAPETDAVIDIDFPPNYEIFEDWLIDMTTHI